MVVTCNPHPAALLRPLEFTGRLWAAAATTIAAIHTSKRAKHLEGLADLQMHMKAGGMRVAAVTRLAPLGPQTPWHMCLWRAIISQAMEREEGTVSALAGETGRLAAA